MAWAGALNMAVSAGLGAFIRGVERGWWDGPASCTSRGVDLLNSDCGLLDPDCGTPVVLCDEIPWQMLGLSMANYNAIISLVLLGSASWRPAARPELRSIPPIHSAPAGRHPFLRGPNAPRQT